MFEPFWISLYMYSFCNLKYRFSWSCGGLRYSESEIVLWISEKKILVIWKIFQPMIMKYYPACTDLDWIRHTILTFSFFPVKWAKIDKWEWSIATTIRNKKSTVNRVSKMDNTCIYKLICLWKKIRCSQLVYGTVIGNEPSER